MLVEFVISQVELKMRREFRFICIIAALTTNNASQSQEFKHKALAENIGALAVAKRWCEEYQVDLESGVRLVLEKGINPTKGQFSIEVEKTKEKMEGYLENLGVNKFCAITYERYKPGGLVPGFMAKK